MQEVFFACDFEVDFCDGQMGGSLTRASKSSSDRSGPQRGHADSGTVT